MVRIERNFQTFDVTKFGKFIFQLTMFHLFWNIPNENIMGIEFFLVGSEQLFVELKGTALLSIDLKVSHSFASFIKLNGILDVDNGRVKWSGDVSSDLGLYVQVDICLSFESFSNFLAADVFFW